MDEKRKTQDVLDEVNAAMKKAMDDEQEEIDEAAKAGMGNSSNMDRRDLTRFLKAVDDLIADPEKHLAEIRAEVKAENPEMTEAELDDGMEWVRQHI